MSRTTVVLEDIEYKDDGTLWWKRSGKGRNLNKPIGTRTYQGYLQMTLNRAQKKVHHVVWFLHTGKWPDNLDHINKIKDDNRIENLREGASVNNHNRDMPLPSTGLMGAHWNKQKKKYKSSIKIKGKHSHLGYFNTAEEAHKVYVEEKKLCLEQQ